MTLNFGTSGSRIECSCCGYRSYIWIPVGEATGLGFCSGKVQYEGYQWEQLMGDLKFPSKAHFESDPILGWSRGLQNPYYRGGQSG